MIQLSVTIIALTLFIEIVDKELLNTGYAVDENGKAVTFLSLEEKDLVSL